LRARRVRLRGTRAKKNGWHQVVPAAGYGVPTRVQE
jgi:hypothetical protein